MNGFAKVLDMFFSRQESIRSFFLENWSHIFWGGERFGELWTWNRSQLFWQHFQLLFHGQSCIVWKDPLHQVMEKNTTNYL